MQIYREYAKHRLEQIGLDTQVQEKGQNMWQN